MEPAWLPKKKFCSTLGIRILLSLIFVSLLHGVLDADQAEKYPKPDMGNANVGMLS